jgi:predicted deacylase
MQAQTHLISMQDSSTAYQLTSFHFGVGGSGKKVYIQAALHADEVPGMLVSQFLRSELLALEAAGKLRGEIVLVPAANPIGLAQAIIGAPFGRFDLSTGTNFNRAYKHVAEDLKAIAGRPAGRRRRCQRGPGARACQGLGRQLAPGHRRRGAQENPAGDGDRRRHRARPALR